VSCNIESRQFGVRALFAIASQVAINQAGIPLRNILIFQLQLLARVMWCVDDEHVGPLHESFENFSRVGRFQIESNPPLVAIGQMPLISVFGERLWRKPVPVSPRFTLGWFDFDYVSAEVG